MADETVVAKPTPGSTVRARRWKRVLWAAVAVYWIAMFVGSHAPIPPGVVVAPGQDKLVHLTAFAGLSFLLFSALHSSRQLDHRLMATVVALMIAYGVFDELTQPLVGRTCDAYDLVADALGAILGLVCYSVMRGLVAWRASAG